MFNFYSNTIFTKIHQKGFVHHLPKYPNKIIDVVREIFLKFSKIYQVRLTIFIIYFY